MFLRISSEDHGGVDSNTSLYESLDDVFDPIVECMEGESKGNAAVSLASVNRYTRHFYLYSFSRPYAGNFQQGGGAVDATALMVKWVKERRKWGPGAWPPEKVEIAPLEPLENNVEILFKNECIINTMLSSSRSPEA